MNNLKLNFREKLLLPVIHTIDETKALKNLELIQKCGCKGAFFINHSISSQKLFKILEKVADNIDDFVSLGINVLDLSPKQTFQRMPKWIDFVWTDNALISEVDLEQKEAVEVKKEMDAWAPPPIYFGGVAFKYQEQPKDLRFVAKEAMKFMHVVTTSGTGTGIQPSLTKIRVIKETIGDFPLAVASGITSENVKMYLPYVDYFLVATGISKTFDELCPEKIKELQEIISAYGN